MATLEQLEAGIAGQLVLEASATVLGSWSEPDAGPATGTLTARVRVSQTDEVRVGSNLTVRTAEAVVEVWKRGTNIWALETVEAEINAALESIVALTFWTGIAEVRQTPEPEIEIESEPERIGEVLTFAVRARVALES